MEPNISVIVPAYNVEKYIKRAVDSILAQTYQDIEILIIDDASTDNTLDIIQRYYSEEKRIRIITHQKNCGLGAARNTGIKHALGKYIAFVDSDDWIECDMLEKLYKIAEAKNADVIACGIRLVFEDGTIKSYHSEKFETEGGLRAIELLTEYKIGTIAWNKLYKRELIIKNDIMFPQIYHEDVSFTIQVAFTCRLFVSISDELYNYYQNPQSITKKKLSRKHIYSYIEIYKLIHQFIKNIGLDKTEKGIELCKKLYSSQTAWIAPNVFQFYNQTEPKEREKILSDVFSNQFGDGSYFVQGLLDLLILDNSKTGNLMAQDIVSKMEEIGIRKSGFYLLKVIKRRLALVLYGTFLYYPIKRVYKNIRGK